MQVVHGVKRDLVTGIVKCLNITTIDPSPHQEKCDF
ncbi:hypothetical protein ATCVNTS1_890R [Acanthocystis turfacea Chlorella virus NTS-1]|nr:hypothetical protein ATCVNTS1_890R [Acanthocystis turfacea Chlorella virus NTS-1]